MTSQSEEAHAMKKTIGVIDKEKDFLQETVDEKTEKIANLQESLASKVCICHTFSGISAQETVFSTWNMEFLHSVGNFWDPWLSLTDLNFLLASNWNF